MSVERRAGAGTSESPLARLRVLQLGESVPAAFAGKLLSDLGSSVAYVPNGADLGVNQMFDTASVVQGEAYRLYFDQRKRPVGDGKEEIVEEIASSDVVLLDQKSLGDHVLSPDRLLLDFPSLVVTTICPYGMSGPRASWRATDFTLQARGGLSYGVGEADGPPLPLPGRQAEMQGGLVGAIGSLLAVLARRDDGSGQHVDISIDDAISTLFTGYYLPRYIYGGGIPGRRSGRVGSNSPYPNTVMRCRDGLVALIAPQIDQWVRFVKLMGEPEWSKDPRYRNRRAMQWEYKDEVDRLVEPWFLERSKWDLIQQFISNRIPFAPLLEGRDLLQNEHLRARSALCSIPTSLGTEAQVPEAPYLIDGRRPNRAAEVASENTTSRAPSAAGRSRLLDGATPPGALAGFRVLDLGTAWAGGMAGRLLADFGAEVIKVECSRHLDGSRKGRPIGVEDVNGGDEGRWPDMQPGFHVIARNKLSVGLDLQAAGAAQLVGELAGNCDAVIHNFSAGVMDRLGLTDDLLRSNNEELLIVGQSIAGYSGPMAGYVGYNSTVGGLSGFFHRIGFEGEPPIGTAEGLYSDIVSALTTVFVVLASLVGGGRATVEISQWEATMALIPEVLIAASTDSEVLPCARRQWGVAPDGVYRCAGDDQWLAMSVPDADSWTALCRLTGRPDLAEDPELATFEGRRRRAGEIDEVVTAWSTLLDASSAAELAQLEGIAADAANNIENLFADEHLRSRQAWVDTEHPLLGFEPLPGAGIALSRTPGTVETPAPFIGQHTDLVFGNLLGYDVEKIDQLVTLGVVERAAEPVQR